MVKVLLYQKESEVVSYLKNELIQNDILQLVAPNPEMADLGREKFENEIPSINAITFAKFMKDNSKFILKKNPEFELYKKSKLFLFLANAYKKNYQEYDYNQFETAFNLLTQIRSYTQDLNTIQDILTTNLKADERIDCLDFICDPYVVELVTFFHLIMENVHAIDEHRLTKEVTESIRENTIVFQNGILFWGFDFFNPMQVEMLMAIGNCVDVYIPMPKMAKDESTQFDWINWLMYEEVNLSALSSYAIKDALEVVYFRPGYLAEVVKSVAITNMDIYLGSNSVDVYNHFDIPIENLSYKTNMELFHEVLAQVQNELLSYIKKNQNDCESLILFLQNEAKVNISKKDFKKIKVLSLAISSLKLYQELNAANVILNNFDIKVIMEVLSLDVPRTSFILTTAEKNITRLRNLSHLIALDYQKTNIAIFSSNFNGLKFNSDGAMDAVLRNLSIIGPVRTKEFDFILMKSRLHEMFQFSNCLLLLENQLLEHDPGVNNLLENFQLIESQKTPRLNADNKVRPESHIVNSKKLDKISATKLQTYLDCPLQYYHKYHAKDFPQIKLAHKWNNLEVGQLEHRVIANYVNDNVLFNEIKYNDLIISELKNYASTCNKKMSDHDLLAPFVEIKSKTHNIVMDLLALKNKNDIKYTFELPLPTLSDYKSLGITVQGSVDLFARGDFVMLVDFKRSGGSIPTRADFFNFIKVQLWFYLQRLRDQISPQIIFGYINLTEIEKSLLFVTDNGLYENLKSMNLRLFESLEIFPKELSDELVSYRQIEENVISRLSGEQLFLPKPRESALCNFCELNLVCTKGVSV